jgi:hypothetical protein
MRYAVSLSLLALVACGGSSGSTTTGTTDPVAILTIKPGGITTQTGGSATFSVPNPGVVQFTNGDTAAHSIKSTGPADCNALNTGTIAAGASTAELVLSNNTTANEICSFSDSLNPSPAFSGQVTILTSNTGGSGY